MTAKSARAPAVRLPLIFSKASLTRSKGNTKNIRRGSHTSNAQATSEYPFRHTALFIRLETELMTETREPTLRMTMLPRDTNARGTIFGGVILSHIDLAGAIAASRQAARNFVTRAMREVGFIAPVYVGDVVSFNTKEARSELLRVLAWDPQNAEALSKMARVYIEFADLIPESSPDWQAKRMVEYRTAEDYARKSVKADPNSTWGHFYVAASLGNVAALSPVAKQIDLAGEIREAIEKAIALDPQNDFAYHVYGIWHRKMAEIGKTKRLFAAVLYGRSVPKGSLDQSIDYLRKAVALDPTVIASRLELAKSYVAVENWTLARKFLVSVRELPVQFSDDAKHKQKAEQLLEEIKER